MNQLLNLKNNKYAVIGGICLAAALLMGIMIYGSKVYATEDYWEIKAGDKTIAIVNSESNANKVINGVKNNFVAEGAKVKSITCEPELKAVQKNLTSDKKPKTVSAKDAINTILTGGQEVKSYVVQDGDTPWDIALNNNLSYDEFVAMNSDKDFSTVLPGDTFNLVEAKPYVNVKVDQVVTSNEVIVAETTYEDTDSLYEDEEEVKEAGENGAKEVVARQISVNGRVTESTTISEKVVKEAKNEIVSRGTKARPSNKSNSSSRGSSSRYASAASYSGNGGSVASFATQFVGNPYVWGGKSLTNGCDCYGFVWAVYQQFGVNVGFGGTNGTPVSTGDMQPGDVLVYGGHYSIYIGGGQEVHALNPSQGIMITRQGAANTGPVLSVRRYV